MPDIGWMILVAGWGALVVIGWRAAVRLRNRRVGDDPTCGACGYSLVGLPETSNRCPECGTDIRAPGAVQRGYNRSLRPVLVWMVGAIVGVVLSHVAAGWVDQQHAEYRDRPLALVNAVRAGNLAESIRLLALEPGLVARTTCSPPIIVMAVRVDSVPIVQALMPTVDIRMKVPIGQGSQGLSAPATLLHIASQYGATNVMTYLLDSATFSVNERDDRGRTPLHFAVARFDDRSIRVLVKRPGIDLDAIDQDGQTPLSLAMANGAVQSAKMLLDAGCKIVGVSGADRWTPLHHAISSAWSDLAWNMILRGADIMAQDAQGRTAFGIAKDDNLDAQIVARKVLYAAREKDGVAGLVALFKIEPRLRFFAGQIFAEESDPKLFSDLLAAGVDPNGRSQSGDTALHRLMNDYYRERLSVHLHQLVEAKADFNATNTLKQTPFMLACKVHIGNSVAGDGAIDLLIEHGADIHRTDLYGNTAMYYAAIYGSEARVKRLQTMGLRLDLAAIMRLKDTDALKQWLDTHPDEINTGKNVDGYAPIHLAIVTRNLEALKLVGSLGADINLRSKLKSRPIDLACGNSNLDAAWLLVERGADLSSQREHNSSAHPLQSAILHGWTDLVKAMLDRGADPNLENNSRDRPLDMAISFRQVECVKLLLSRGADRTKLSQHSRETLDKAQSTDKSLLQIKQLLDGN